MMKRLLLKLGLLLLLASGAQAATPGLVHWQCTTPANETNATPFHYNVKYWGALGTGTLANNLLVVIPSYAHGVTITISDNKSSTYTAGPVADSGATDPITDMRYVAGVAAGVTAITITTSAASFDFQVCVGEFNNVATSSPSDGSCHSIDTGPSPVDCDAAITTTSDGDLILSLGLGNSGGSSGFCNDPATAVTPGSGFTNLNVMRFCTEQSQFQVQTTHGAINPSFTTTGSADNYGFVAQAFKSAAAGTAPTGMYIAHECTFIINTATQTFDCPSSGNLLVGAVDDTASAGGDSVTIDTCTPSNGTWTKVNPLSTDPQMFHADNASTSSTLHCVAHAGTPSNSTLLTVWDVVGAATSPLDTSATCSSGTSGQCHNEQTTSITSPWNDRPDITPSTQPGISFAVIQVGNGPITSVGSGFLLKNTTYNGETDSGKLNNGDGWSFAFYSSTSQLAYSWNNTNSSTFSVVALAFQAPAASNQPIINKREKLDKEDSQ